MHSKYESFQCWARKRDFDPRIEKKTTPFPCTYGVSENRFSSLATNCLGNWESVSMHRNKSQWHLNAGLKSQFSRSRKLPVGKRCRTPNLALRRCSVHKCTKSPCSFRVKETDSKFHQAFAVTSGRQASHKGILHNPLWNWVKTRRGQNLFRNLRWFGEGPGGPHFCPRANAATCALELIYRQEPLGWTPTPGNLPHVTNKNLFVSSIEQ